VSFYRTSLPTYASVIHPGGAPNWLLRSWIEKLRADMRTGEVIGEGAVTAKPVVATIPKPIEDDIHRLGIGAVSGDEPLSAFLDLLDAEPARDVTDVNYPV